MAIRQRRMGALFAVFFLLLVLAAGRTLYFAAVRSATLRKAAQAQQLSTETLPAERGTITDRNGVDLAVSEPADDISADPFLLKDPLAVAEKLAPLLEKTRDEVLAKLSRHSGFVYLARALNAGRAHQILALKIPGIDASVVMRRVYPRGSLAAQVLGLVGTEGKGLAGLEYSQDARLRGRPGQRRVVSDALGQPVSISTVHPEVPGSSVTLTIDSNIQQHTEDVLSAVGHVFSPKDATAIVMDPRNGAIYAMASWPRLNDSITGSVTEEALQNRAVSFDYEPGSTFKVVAISGALQEGLVTPETSFSIPDQIQVADRTIHDDAPHPEETLTTSQILAQSSNVGAIKVGSLEGADRFNQWVHRFGFGSSTGIDLPGEERGQALALDKYSGSSMGNLPIGQGELVTPIQIATAYSAIANGGVLRSPHVIKAIGGRAAQAPTGHRVVSAATAAEVRQMLKGVLAPGGTASQVSVPGYELAGKTGTASKIDPATGQYSESAYVASFVGFAPATNPELLCAVIVDEPKTGSIYGGAVAAPAFGEIMSFALPYLGVPPR